MILGFVSNSMEKVLYNEKFISTVSLGKAVKGNSFCDIYSNKAELFKISDDAISRYLHNIEVYTRRNGTMRIRTE